MIGNQNSILIASSGLRPYEFAHPDLQGFDGNAPCEAFIKSGANGLVWTLGGATGSVGHYTHISCFELLSAQLNQLAQCK